MKDWQAVSTSLAIGIVSSLLAVLIQSWFEGGKVSTTLLLLAALVVAIIQGFLTWKKLNTLSKMGIKRWEARMSHGTTTASCIERSHKDLAFMGVAASKWLKEEILLRKMLLRHASSGGKTQFLLLDPDSAACSNFEKIKKQEPGSLAKIIRGNIHKLQELQKQSLPVEVRLYSEAPHFRMVIIDDCIMTIGLYSYSSQTGEDTPQLILEREPQEWSYYYGFNAFFAQLWNRSSICAPDASAVRDELQK